jgi:hypothetical protein
MTVERWSIVLETVAFFLVTVDLYGRDRLQIIQARLENYVAKLSAPRLVSWFRDEGFNSNSKLFGGVEKVSFGMLPILVLGVAVVFWIWKGWTWWLLIAIPLALLVPMIVYPLSLFFIFAMLWSLSQLLLLTVSGLLYSFKRWELEGIMLTAGAFLFVTSRALIFFAPHDPPTIGLPTGH